MRIDYFSMMRKWHVGLYRYGLRLTYDIAIPEPGATMRRLYAQLDNLTKQLGPFNFLVTHSEIDPDNTDYLDLANQFNAQVPAPPASSGQALTPNSAISGLETQNWHFFQLQFAVP